MSTAKVAVITGASAGIGRTVAQKYAEKKFNLTLVARGTEKLAELARELELAYGISCLTCPGNLADKAFLRSVIDQTESKWGVIDVLVNNAAWRTIETMRTISFDSWEETFAICVTAPAFLARWSAEVMEKNGTKGVIINVSTVMSDRAGGTSPAYIASKGALESLTYELAVTYGRSAIRVLCIRPGNISTNMSSDYTDRQGINISDKLTGHLNDLTPLARPGTVQEIADAIYWLSTGEASFITGTTLLIDGGLNHNFNGYSFKKLQFPNEF